MKTQSIMMAVAGAALAAMPVQAGHFIGTYTSSSQPFLAHLNFTTSDTVNGVGAYDVLSISGDVDGDAITGLITNPAQPNQGTSPDGLFYFDNDYYSTTPVFDGGGILFSTASGTEYNFWGNNPTSYTLYSANVNGYSFNSNGTFDVSVAVPEPASWALMVAGFGVAGFAMRNRRQRTAFV